MIRREWPWVMAGGLLLALTGFILWLAFIGAFDHDPYHDMPATGPVRRPDVAAVLLSGDMGFRIGMGSEVAERIAAAGIPVTGVNSLAAFRKRRSPDEIARFVASVMAHARARTGARHLILIGQSFGADMLHVALSRLPPDERRNIPLVAMVVPTDTVYYQISLGEMFEWDRPDADAAMTAHRLDWAPVLCIQGVEEVNSLCPHLTLPNMRRVALPGGHPLHHDADAVAHILLRAIDETTGRSARPQR